MFADALIAAMAGTVIVLALVKLSVLLLHPESWFGLVKRLYAHPPRATLVALAVAAIELSLLLLSGMNILQILAVSLFVATLMVAGFEPLAPMLFAWLEAQNIRALLLRQKFYVLAWLILLVWGGLSLVQGG